MRGGGESGSRTRVVVNQYAGHILRTKLDGVDEGASPPATPCLAAPTGVSDVGGGGGGVRVVDGEEEEGGGGGCVALRKVEATRKSESQKGE